MNPAKTAGPIEMLFGLRTWVGPGHHVLDGGPDPPMRRGNFEGRKGRPIVKYRDTLRSPVRIRLKRSRCRLGCGLVHRCKNVFLTFFNSCRVFYVFNVFYFPYVFKIKNVENLLSVQANSEI